jgi:hypothetical protein
VLPSRLSQIAVPTHPARGHPAHSLNGRTEMLTHRYKVGKKVRFFQRTAISPRKDDAAASERDESSAERYEITRLLPSNGAEFQYRIKKGSKGQERVVTESEIG